MLIEGWATVEDIHHSCYHCGGMIMAGQKITMIYNTNFQEGTVISHLECVVRSGFHRMDEAMWQG